MDTLWSIIVFLVVGGIIGWLGQAIVGKNAPGGIIGNVIIGWIGSALGGYLPFLQFGPQIGQFSIIPAIIGAVIVVFIYDLVTAR